MLIIPRIDMVTSITFAPLVNRIHAVPAHNAGWLEGTTWIDDTWGRVVLAGHNPGVFYRVGELVPGDLIVVVGQSGRVRYAVTSVEIVNRDAWQLLAPTQTPTLLLITCLFDGSEDRIVVMADRME